MRRRMGVFVASVLLAFGGFAMTGVAHAAPVNAFGAIKCFWTGGKVTFKPAFVNGGTSPSVVKFHGSIGQCTDSEEGGPAPFGITSGKVRGSFRVAKNACDFDTVGDSTLGGPGTAKIVWKGAQKVAPTQVTASTVGFEFGETNYASFPRNPGNAVASATGSFAGGINVFFDGLNPPGYTERACTPKTKGLPGSGGLKHLDVDTDGYTAVLTLP